MHLLLNYLLHVLSFIRLLPAFCGLSALRVCSKCVLVTCVHSKHGMDTVISLRLFVVFARGLPVLSYIRLLPHYGFYGYM